jgi:hypothetical protein
MSDDLAAADSAARRVRCARCVRSPRDPDDRATWVIVDDDRICPGCLTLSDRERLRMDGDH